MTETHEILLTCNSEGFWLAQSYDYYGDVETQPDKAIMSLLGVEGLLDNDGGAMIIDDEKEANMSDDWRLVKVIKTVVRELYAKDSSQEG